MSELRRQGQLAKWFDELLVENDEIIRLDLLPPTLPAARNPPAPRTHRHRQEPLFLQPVPDVISVLPHLN